MRRKTNIDDFRFELAGYGLLMRMSEQLEDVSFLKGIG